MANVTITTDLDPNPDIHFSENTIVFVTTLIGYIFYVGAGNDLAYKKTIDGGASWGSEVTIDSSSLIRKASFFHGKWSNAASPDNLIHMAYARGIQNYYRNLDPDDSDSLSSPVTVGSLAISEDYGQLYIRQNSDKKVFIIAHQSGSTPEITKSNVGLTSFSAIAASGIAADGAGARDDFAMAPHPTSPQDMMFIWSDNSVNDLQTRIYDESTNTWLSTWSILDFAFNTLLNGRRSLQAEYNLVDDLIYLAGCHFSSGTAGNVRCYTFDGASWSSKTDIYSFSTDTTVSTSVGLGVNNLTGDVYAMYNMGDSPGDMSVKYTLTDDGGTTWEDEKDLSDVTDDLRHIYLSSAAANSRIYAAWVNDDLNDLIGDSILEIGGTTEETEDLVGAYNVELETTTDLVGAYSVAPATFESLVCAYAVFASISTAIVGAYDVAPPPKDLTCAYTVTVQPLEDLTCAYTLVADWIPRHEV